MGLPMSGLLFILCFEAVAVMMTTRYIKPHGVAKVAVSTPSCYSSFSGIMVPLA